VNVRPIIQRLRDAVPVLKQVGGAYDYEAAASVLKNFPAAFVLPAAESASDNPFMDQLVEQRVSAECVVLIAVRNLSDAVAEAAAQSLEPVRLAIREALLGWVPEGAEDNVEFVQGAMLVFANGVLWWQDFYRTAYLIRSQ